MLLHGFRIGLGLLEIGHRLHMRGAFSLYRVMKPVICPPEPCTGHEKGEGCTLPRVLGNEAYDGFNRLLDEAEAL